MPVNESNTIQYTVTTSRIADGTTLYWKTTGNTTNSDIVGGNTGSIVINNNRAVFNVTLANDLTTDNTKTLGISLLTGSLNGTTVTTTPTPIVINDTSQTPTDFQINYLVVAGGGAGGAGDAGGGGAGGMLTGSFTSYAGTSYVITVGAGGTVSAPGVTSGSGSLSKIEKNSGPQPFSTITSTGGGVGGGYNWAGQPGGSGGGGSNAMPNSLGTAIGSPGSYGVAGPQGYPGGGGPGNGGGGGGAGAAGNPTTPWSSSYGSAQAGGSGALWPFTNTYYAGGGGNGNGGAGGQGGGGAGTGDPNGYVGTPGSVNTGGGGGAGYFSGWAGDSGKIGAGGSGVIILAIPTPNYPGSAPGATVTTPPAAPGKTIVRFTSSGTYTA
jgi:hypothetical protein